MDTKPGTTKKRNSNKSFPDPLRGYLYTRQTVWLISSRATVRLFIHFICVKDEAFYYENLRDLLKEQSMLRV